MSDKLPNGNDKFVIQLMIGKKEFPITIRRDEEEVYRKAAKQINEKLNRYEQAYPNLEPERYTRITLGLPALEGEEKDEKSTDC